MKKSESKVVSIYFTTVSDCTERNTMVQLYIMWITIGGQPNPNTLLKFFLLTGLLLGFIMNMKPVFTIQQIIGHIIRKRLLPDLHILKACQGLMQLTMATMLSTLLLPVAILRPEPLWHREREIGNLMGLAQTNKCS